MERTARITRTLQRLRNGQAIEIAPGQCRVEGSGSGFLLRWDVPGRTESLQLTAAELEALLARHDIVFTSW